ncbi:MAG: ABC transporter ATP-binding protein, partial [Paracoccaceae bacterium]
YEDDLPSYRKLLLSNDRPAGKPKQKPVAKIAGTPLPALRSQVRSCEARVEKLNRMRDRLAGKLASPELYEDGNIGAADVWQKKYAEVMEALDRAEALWLAALEKLEIAEG